MRVGSVCVVCARLSFTHARTRRRATTYAEAHPAACILLAFSFFLQGYLLHGITILCLAPVEGQEDVDVLVYMLYIIWRLPCSLVCIFMRYGVGVCGFC